MPQRGSLHWWRSSSCIRRFGLCWPDGILALTLTPLLHHFDWATILTVIISAECVIGELIVL
jgi:hypothetical protein